jgi:chemotaxis response regulator CheB
MIQRPGSAAVVRVVSLSYAQSVSGIEHSSAGKRVAAPAGVASHLVVIGFSAAGLEPLWTALRHLTPAFPGSIVVVHHVREKTELPAILKERLHLDIQVATPGAVLRSGTVFVCPADRNIFVNPDRTVGLAIASRAVAARPADWLFESAAAVFGACGIAVVLSGRLSDGACGASSIKRCGGRVIVQAPSTCGYPSMPLAAIATGCVDLVLDPAAIGAALQSFVAGTDGSRWLDEWQRPFGRTA